MRFLVDAQLPPALVRSLVTEGHEAWHVADCGLQSASDHLIWTFAVENRYIIITKDEDFARRRAVRADGPQIVWLRLPNARRRDLLKWFEQALPTIVRSLDRGEGIIEVL